MSITFWYNPLVDAEEIKKVYQAGQLIVPFGIIIVLKFKKVCVFPLWSNPIFVDDTDWTNEIMVDPVLKKSI
jgi:hypothetical protein